MRRGASGLGSPLAALVALCLGLPAGWHLATLWPAMRSTPYPVAHIGGALIQPIAALRSTQQHALPPPPPRFTVATLLEHSLDATLRAFEGGTGSPYEDIDPASRQRARQLAASYRAVFPTPRLDVRGKPLPPPPPAAGFSKLSALESRELRAALGSRRTELEALWQALRGLGGTLELTLPQGPEDLILRVDHEGVRGRIRLYGDGRVAITLPTSDAPEIEVQLGRAEVEDWVDRLVAGGILAPEELQRWLAHGGQGCQLPSQSSGYMMTQQIAPTSIWIVLTEARESRHGATLGAVSRRMTLPKGLLSQSCHPRSASVLALREALIDLTSMAAEIAQEGGRPIPDDPSSAREFVHDLGRYAVAYQSPSNSRQIAVRQDSGSEKLLSRGQPVVSFAASPDGRHLAIARAGQLSVLAENEAATPIDLAPGSQLIRTGWSHDGSSLAISTRSRTGTGDILVGRGDGAALASIQPSSNTTFMAWSPDGRYLYTGSWQRHPALTVLARDGTSLSVTNRLSIAGYRAEISPDGRSLAYRATVPRRPGAAHVLVTLELDPETGQPRRPLRPIVIDPTASEYTWSPGGQLVYIRHGSIFEVGSDGRGARRLVDGEFGRCMTTAPQVSPDDRWLLFVRCRDEIYVAHRDGSAPNRLAQGQRPQWVAASFLDPD